MVVERIGRPDHRSASHARPPAGGLPVMRGAAPVMTNSQLEMPE